MILLRASVLAVLLLGLVSGQINFSTGWGGGKRSAPQLQQNPSSSSLLQIIRPDLLLLDQLKEEKNSGDVICRSLYLIRQSIQVSHYYTARCLQHAISYIFKKEKKIQKYSLR